MKCEVGLRDGKTEAIAQVIRRRLEHPIHRLLVVGCGSGVEAAILAKEFGASAVGVDKICSFDPLAAKVASLQCGDATALAFNDESFDLVFSYHALEHIPEYRKALGEMRRVLRANGIYCVGTPNRCRFLGYLGSKDATLRQKIAWNCADWSARFKGKFRNEHGAHAGFAPEELLSELQNIFSCAEGITLNYYEQVYRTHSRLLSLLDRSGIGRYIFPSLYFLGKR